MDLFLSENNNWMLHFTSWMQENIASTLMPLAVENIVRNVLLYN